MASSTMPHMPVFWLPYGPHNGPGRFKSSTSHMTVMECLIMPLRKQDAQLIANFEQTFKSPGLSIIPIDEPVLRAAAQLRATHKSLRTPDAIHAASCFSTNASLFVTNDRGFRAIPGLPLALLDDILASP